MAAKKKEIRKVAPPAKVEGTASVLRVYLPEKGKKTQMIDGPATDAARELVARLRDDARVI
jgi:electron transfer flavoprotein alpha/beta subunit